MSAGQDHSIEGLLLWRHYLWDSLSAVGGLQKDFQVLPSFPILCLPVLSNWRCEPLTSFAMSQLWRYISVRQLPDEPSTVPFNVLQTPVMNSADPWLLCPSPRAHPALKWGGEGLLSPALETLALSRGFVVGSRSMLTPLRWRNEAGMEVTGQRSQGWICYPPPLWPILFCHHWELEALTPSPRLCSQPSAREGAS